MAKILKLVRIGNSKGIRIPQALIQRYHLGEEVQVRETAEGLLLLPPEAGKLSLEESLAAMAAEKQPEVVEWDSTLQDGLEEEDFRGWPQ